MPESVRADHQPTTLVVTITDTPDPVPGASNLTYSVAVKNNGKVKSTNLKVEMPLPAGTQFVSCKTSQDTSSIKRCQQEVPGVAVARLPILKAWRTATVTLVVKTPAVPANTQITFSADATGDKAHKGDDTERTTVLAPAAPVVLWPSGRQTVVRCGDILNSAFFGSDTTVQLTGALGCVAGGSGLRIAASGVTLALNGQKIIVSDEAAGNIGIHLVGVSNVTIDGGGTNGTNGVEFFDFCVKDEGGNGNVIKNLRCYGARSAALDIASNNVLVDKVKLDNTAPKTGTTAESPGGVGVHARGDDIRIKDSIIRRSKVIGLWASGLDGDGDGRVVTMDGNLLSSRIEDCRGIGAFLENGSHLLKDTTVYGDGPTGGTATDGVVVVVSGIGSVLDGVSVKKFGGNGIVVQTNSVVVQTSGARLETTAVEDVALDGFVIQGSGTTLNNNSTTRVRDGFVIAGPDNVLTDNNAEAVRGNGFYVTGTNTDSSGDDARNNGLHGFFLAGSGGSVNTNNAEGNAGNGFHITGTNNFIENSSAQENSGIGFNVLGSGNIFNTDDAVANNGPEWVIGVNNDDDGNNAANGQPISFGSTGGTFE
jgi:uncharacterized repeat protein (TIGR01451 family)